MGDAVRKRKIDWLIGANAFLLIAVGVVVLLSVAPQIFPAYIIFIVIGILSFIFFASIDFEVFVPFSKYIYIISIILLAAPLIIGQVTRGTVRWVSLGSYSIQPAEVVRPFLVLFFAWYFSKHAGTFKSYIKGIVLAVIPLVLILVQPSLGVSTVTFSGLVVVILLSRINTKYIIASLIGLFIVLPVLWLLLAPYQRARIEAFVSPSDPLGAGYNSVQSMISVGSGGLSGRGLGKGVQTQLSFLPERQTDFIFASASEELGFVGAALIMVLIFVLFFRIATRLAYLDNSVARGFVSGVWTILLVQAMAHIGMNLGLLPITGLPLPLVSAGGSSLVATMTSLGMISAALNSHT